MVRFEDAKLNPTATFTALAAFLDLPYTESMTYCSELGQRDPHADYLNYTPGMNTASVYTKHPDFADDAELAFLEYCFRDAYAYYGYDFQYYHGEDPDELVDRFRKLDAFVRAD